MLFVYGLLGCLLIVLCVLVDFVVANSVAICKMMCSLRHCIVWCFILIAAIC